MSRTVNIKVGRFTGAERKYMYIQRARQGKGRGKRKGMKLGLTTEKPEYNKGKY